MLRTVIAAAGRSERIKRLVATVPVSRSVVARFVAGESVDDAVRATRELLATGRRVSLDHLGEDTRDAASADAATTAYLTLLDRLADGGLTTTGAEVSVKLSAVGLGVDRARARANAAAICAAAAAAGTTVTLDMEDHTSTDATLAILADLRREYPATGAVIQAYLHRSEGDCRDLAGPASRVRLCKGAYTAPAAVAFTRRRDVDRSYARCLRVLMAGAGYPMVATHDPRLIRLAGALVTRHARSAESYEYQLLYGVRRDEQARLASAGETVRVYVPYGDQWYGYLMRRLAERPANLAFFLRALASRS